MSESPAEYIEKLKAENKQLRAELIKARAELDESALTVARLVLEKKQYADVMVAKLAELDVANEALAELDDVKFHGGPGR